ncbi:DUF6585 family protein [Streptomyces showdoensis]|uniref:Uncharacterized protein n=1 Tax=Streptomyces showdoensis TaxID=68268 RepID=A0A2P2GHQ7_STREW|nr:DUF6585 family protein [Streptomyces showdoensis]KKZ71056.1 hypothetical protein VO63_25350 [Streptomyces showdoensis]
MASERGTARVPDALRVVAREHGLGARKGLVQNEPKRFPWGGVLPVGVLGAFLGWLALSYAIEDQREQGAWYYSLPLLVLAAIPLGFVGYVLFAWLFRPRPPQIWVAWYEHGALWHVDRGGTSAYTWDEIASVTRQDVKVTNGVTSATTHRLTVTSEDGAEIVVGDEFSGIVPFAEGLVDAFSRARVPRDAARLEAGERIGFGAVDIDVSGVGQGSRRIGWREVERIEVKQGRVEIRRRGERKPWMTLAAPGFPDLPVFLTLADALRRQHES